MFQETYDHFGNRNVEYFTYGSNPATQPFPYLTFTSGNNHAANQSYDYAGHLTTDGTNDYLYDAENRLCAVKQLSSGGLIGFFYAPDGPRLGKQASLKSFSCDVTKNGMLTASGLALSGLYTFGSQGEQLLEVDQNLALKHMNVFWEGKLLGSYSGSTYSQANWHFALNDWLGTKRVTTQSNGAPWTSIFSGPFGDYQTQTGPGSDPSEHHFTGKERDAESGLDYFGARMYASTMGRWMSPDPSNLGVDIYMPQTWNKYNYAVNNPLTIKDANGLWPFYVHDQIINESFPGMSKQDLQSLKNASWNMDFGSGQEAPRNAPQHGMQDGSGDVGGNPYYMQQLAHQDADDFISQQVSTAQQAQADWEAQGHSGIAPAAMTAFGNALHTATDRTSPAHEGEQPWANKPWWSRATLTHIWGEAFGRNAAQKAASDAAARGLFQRTFGNEFGWMLQKAPCFSTSASDNHGNSTGSSGCQ